ncbi:MAG: type II toxin-antitoxin system RelE/ParE family toxin [Cyanothece sp. SIO2G6]|nr:type II toxin-antitoxin system RelE/ParE family toxin [Cyanothece sp. SIO2G6]
MVKVLQTDTFASWFKELRDRRAKARIQARIDRMSLGNLGDFKAVGDGVCEIRIHYGPGYRVYYKKQGDMIIILLCGGDKSSQVSDIKKAKQIAKQVED